MLERLAPKALLLILVRVPEYPLRLHHKTPGWVDDGSLFHIRIRVADEQSVPVTDPAISSKLLASARDYHGSGRWWCELFLLMPDHLHAIIAFPREPGMPVVIRNWKRAAARLQSVRWQENFFDHRLRHLGEGREKWLYIRRNPVVKGLCPVEEDWPYWWSSLLDRSEETR